MPEVPRGTLAARERKRRIAVLQACKCEYPLTIFRNMSGHAPECPGHTLWLDQRKPDVGAPDA